jgi:hypothetical protein
VFRRPASRRVLDARHEGVRFSGFGDMIIGAVPDASAFHDVVGVVGQDQDRDLADRRIHPNLSAKFVATHSRQVVVNEDQIGAAMTRMLERVFRRARATRVNSLVFEQRHHHKRLGLGTLDNEQCRT